MCQCASGFINPKTFEVRVRDLGSHSNTARALGLTDDIAPDGWREMHYLPNGRIACRVLLQDSHTTNECIAAVLARWPRFVDFLTCAWPQCLVGDTYPGSLYLDGLTSAEGLTLPQSIGGALYLRASVRAELASRADE